MTDILNNISATSMNILMLLLGAIVSFYLFGLIVACVEGLVANSNGARTVSFSFLWWKWQKLSSDGTTVSEKGKWKVSKSKFRIIAELLYIRTNITAEQEKKIRRHTYLILLIIALPVLAGTFFAGYFLPAPFRYFFFGLLIMLTLLAVTVFRTRNSPGSGLEQFRADKTRELFEGKPISEIELPPLEELPYENATKMEKIMYSLSRYRIAEMKNDLAALTETAHFLTEQDTEKLIPGMQVAVDGTLVNYYSFREINAALAKKYYERSRLELEKDKDSNGRRRLAYYAYYIEGDREKAKKYLAEGIKALDARETVMLDVEHDLEEKMLRYLEEQLKANNGNALMP